MYLEKSLTTSYGTADVYAAREGLHVLGEGSHGIEEPPGSNTD